MSTDPVLNRSAQQRWYERNKQKKIALVTETQRRKQRILDELKSVPCADCDKTYPPYVMDFDHRPGEVKCFHVARGSRLPMSMVLLEVQKCDVVCSNCHRIRTFNRRPLGKRQSRLAQNETRVGSTPTGPTKPSELV